MDRPDIFRQIVDYGVAMHRWARDEDNIEFSEEVSRAYTKLSNSVTVLIDAALRQSPPLVSFVHTDAVDGENPQPIMETKSWASPIVLYPYPDVVNPAPADDISIVDTASRQLEVKREYYDELVDLYFARLNAGEDEWTARQTVNDAISFLAGLNKDLDC